MKREEIVKKLSSFTERKNLGNKRKVFSFYLSYFQVFCRLNDKQKLSLFDAMCLYMYFDIIPDFEDDEVLPFVWDGIEPNLDKNKIKIDNPSRGNRTDENEQNRNRANKSGNNQSTHEIEAKNKIKAKNEEESKESLSQTVVKESAIFNSLLNKKE